MLVDSNDSEVQELKVRRPCNNNNVSIMMSQVFCMGAPASKMSPPTKMKEKVVLLTTASPMLNDIGMNIMLLPGIESIHTHLARIKVHFSAASRQTQ